MPVSVYDLGDQRLEAFLGTLDPQARAAVERDWDLVKANPANPPLEWGWWTIPDLIPEPSRVVVLGNRAQCRYVTYDVHPHAKPAIVAIVSLDQAIEPM